MTDYSVRVEDKRGHYFYRIDNAVIEEYGPKIGAYGLAVYNVLAMYAGRKDSAFPSLRTIEKDLGISRPTIVKAIDTLIEVGLITKERRRNERGDHTSNVYTLVPVRGKRDLPRTQQDLPPPVNDIDHGGKPDLPELDSVNDTQYEQDYGTEGADAPAPVAPGKASVGQADKEQAPDLKKNPLVVAFRDYNKRWPTHGQMRQIVEANPDPELWQRAMVAWVGKGYKVTNIEGMLEWALDPSRIPQPPPKQQGGVMRQVKSKVEASMDAVDAVFARIDARGVLSG